MGTLYEGNQQPSTGIVLGDRKLKLRKIAETLKISEGSVFTILCASGA